MWFDETIDEKYQTIDITLIVRIQWKSIWGLPVTSNFYLTILEQYYGLLFSFIFVVFLKINKFILIQWYQKIWVIADIIYKLYEYRWGPKNYIW